MTRSLPVAAMRPEDARVAQATEAYAAYRNAQPERYEDPVDREHFEADREKARRALDDAWVAREVARADWGRVA